MNFVHQLLWVALAWSDAAAVKNEWWKTAKCCNDDSIYIYIYMYVYIYITGTLLSILIMVMNYALKCLNFLYALY